VVNIALVNGGYGELAFMLAQMLSDKNIINGRIRPVDIFVFDDNVNMYPVFTRFQSNVDTWKSTTSTLGTKLFLINPCASIADC
jgi:hypothetical protein